MRFRHLFKSRGLGINLLASFCFLMLAVYGWGMTWEKLGSFLLVLFVLLGGLVAIAACLGWLLNKIKHRKNQPFTYTDLSDQIDADQKKDDQKKTD